MSSPSADGGISRVFVSQAVDGRRDMLESDAAPLEGRRLAVAWVPLPCLDGSLLCIFSNADSCRDSIPTVCRIRRRCGRLWLRCSDVATSQPSAKRVTEPLPMVDWRKILITLIFELAVESRARQQPARPQSRVIVLVRLSFLIVPSVPQDERGLILS